jgi:hypothetical protein
MGFFNQLFSKKEPQSNTQPEFAFGVEDTFRLSGTDDLIVVGQVRGTVIPGATAYLHTWKDNDNTITLVTVAEVEINRQIVSSATDYTAGLRIKDGVKLDIRIGSVLATRSISSDEVHSAYISAIGNSYIGVRHFELSDEELQRMSITDMAEAWRLYLYSNQQGLPGSDPDPAIRRQKIDRLAEVLCKRIMEQEQIHFVFSPLTAEPFLFSETIAHDNGTYESTPPEIMMVTEPYLATYQDAYGKDPYELRTISCKEDPNAIKRLFYDAFYLNGATGLRINSRAVGIVASMLLPPPNYDGIPEIQIPITNPDLMRWKLLMGQLDEPSTEEAQTIYKIYYGFFLRELTKAKFLIPMKQDIPCPPPDENGKTVLKKDTTFALATLPGKEDRPAVRMYTDWKRMQQVFDKDWNSMVQPVSGMIDVMDIAMNVTEHPAVGCYINRQTYEEAVKRAE